MADHSWTRPALGRLIELLHDERTTVRFVAEDDCWVIDWPTASVPLPAPWHGPSPSQEEQQGRDVFFQQYTPGPGDVVGRVVGVTGGASDGWSRYALPANRVRQILADAQRRRARLYR